MPLNRPVSLLAAPLLVLVASSLVGCAAAVPSGGGERIEDGTIVYAHQQEPACIFGGWIEQAYVSYNVLDGLVSLDENHEVVPWLAESWEEAADGLSWTFTLKPGTKFTDGTAVDAEAVVYNFDYWLAGGNSTAKVWLDDYFQSAEAIDRLTVRIALSAPYPRLAENLTQGYFGIQSQDALETRSQEENCSAPIGSGAFVVEEWNRGQNLILARNDDYTSWPANSLHEGPAHAARVDWRFVPDATTRVAALQSGEVDAVYDVPAIQWDALGTAGYALERFITPGRPQQLTFNQQTGPFTDERVRQAFAYSLDRRQIVETIGQGVIPFEGNGGVSQSTPGYSQKAAEWYDYNPEKANELLDDAGWLRGEDGVRTKDGARLEVVLPYGAGSIINADGAAILQGIKAHAEQVGFVVNLIPVPQSELFSGAYSAPEERDIAVGYWTAVTAGILHINWRPSTQESPNYNNQAFIADDVLGQLIRDADSERDRATQEELYGEVQDYLAEHAYSIGLYARLSTLAVAPNLHGVWQEHAQGGPVFHDAYLTE